jgi:hypothetical protein
MHNKFTVIDRQDADRLDELHHHRWLPNNNNLLRIARRRWQRATPPSSTRCSSPITSALTHPPAPHPEVQVGAAQVELYFSPEMAPLIGWWSWCRALRTASSSWVILSPWMSWRMR